MGVPDYESAKTYAIKRLESELSTDLCYHNVSHTVDGVMPAAARLAQLSGIDDEGVELLQVAAAFHDIGYIRVRDGHEVASARIAAQVLPDFGFSDEEIERVMGMILATRLPQSPYTLLEEIMADADLDVLGSDRFFEYTELLRCELLLNGEQMGSCRWYDQQVLFLRGHHYFTKAARDMRDAGKRANLMELLRRKESDC